MHERLTCKKNYLKILNREKMRKKSKRVVKKNHPVYKGLFLIEPCLVNFVYLFDS